MPEYTVELDDFQLRMLCEIAAWRGMKPEACLREVVADWIPFEHEIYPEPDEPWQKPPCDAAGCRFPVELDAGLDRLLREVAAWWRMPVQAYFEFNTWRWLAYDHEDVEDALMQRTSLVQLNGATHPWVNDQIVRQWSKDMTAWEERSLRHRRHSRMWHEG